MQQLTQIVGVLEVQAERLSLGWAYLLWGKKVILH
jgi:hypothetical protein